MKLPKYWAKARVEEPDKKGNLEWFANWGWSDESAADAFEKAQTAARRNLWRLMNAEELARYPYGKLPLREEVIERLTDDSGELIAAVTQNAYGALVLNTSHVMFIDIDFSQPVSPRENGESFLSRLFKRKPVPTEQQFETAALQRIQTF